MALQAKYVHTNLIARDWHALADFYQRVFGCIPVPPERDLSGPNIEAGTGLPSAHLRGMHLRLPGYGDSRPHAGNLQLHTCWKIDPPLR